MKVHILIITIFGFMVFGNIAEATENRLALVIGNSNYAVSPLRNPINDAKAVATALEDLNFTVTLELDLDRIQMEDTIHEFCSKLSVGDIVLVYFSGHGAQVAGDSYLIPINAHINSEVEIKYKTVSINMILEKLEKTESRVNIIILDACRSNPFKNFRASSDGLANVYAPRGTLISYATAPGKVASDGINGNSPYTKSLVSVIGKYGLKVEEVFKQVRVMVMDETNDVQIPGESTSLIGDFYFSDNPTISKRPSPLFELPDNVSGYTHSRLISYMRVSDLPDTIQQNSIVEITYELFDNNIINEITPMFLFLYKRVRPTYKNGVYREQYTISPGINLLRFSADFPLGGYEIELGFYFKDDLNKEYPPFYRKFCQIEIVENDK